MSSFRTEFFIAQNSDPISYDAKLLSIGSGFSETISKNMLKYKYNMRSNPFGTLYNPISIFNVLDICVHNKPIDETLITEHNGKWYHFDFHPRATANSKQELIDGLTAQIAEIHEYLKHTDYLILTLGSAYAYKLKSEQHMVANCHKAPQEAFTKELLSTKQIVDGYRKIYHELNSIKNIILVVSPVMHTRESIPLNAVSKSVLRLACHEIMAEFNTTTKYFPAYEVMLSDLRDYRFYQMDQLHPTEAAEDYIFGKFVNSYMEKGDRECIFLLESILESVKHKPYYNPQSLEYQKALKATSDKIRAVKTNLDLSELIRWVEAKIKG